MDNPYAPPAVASSESVTNKLYSAGQIAWATFLGSPMAGCALIAINDKRLGNSTATIVTLTAGVIGTAVLIGIGMKLPDRFPSSVLPIATTFGMYQLAKSLQGKAYERHLADGGQKASIWAATGIGILSALCLVIALFGVIAVTPEGWFDEDL